jgi:hypothetical protein
MQAAVDGAAATVADFTEAMRTVGKETPPVNGTPAVPVEAVDSSVAPAEAEPATAPETELVAVDS